MKPFLISLFVLTGCASSQVPFQKKEDGIGYSIDSKGPANFLVKVQLPNDFKAESIERYVARAVGEECASRGFSYFDYTSPTSGTSEGFCFKENKRKALGVSFEKERLASRPFSLIVADLNQKPNTNFFLGDKIVKAEGREIASVSALKSLAFHSSESGKDRIQIEVVRQGRPLTFNEPLNDLVDGAHDPASLEALRKKYY